MTDGRQRRTPRRIIATPSSTSASVNTSGGNLSGSYMHGWSQVAEIVRQLRHQAKGRQVPGVQASMFSLTQTDQAHPILFTNGAQP